MRSFPERISLKPTLSRSSASFPCRLLLSGFTSNMDLLLFFLPGSSLLLLLLYDGPRLDLPATEYGVDDGPAHVDPSGDPEHLPPACHGVLRVRGDGSEAGTDRNHCRGVTTSSTSRLKVVYNIGRTCFLARPNKKWVVNLNTT